MRWPRNTTSRSACARWVGFEMLRAAGLLSWGCMHVNNPATGRLRHTRQLHFH